MGKQTLKKAVPLEKYNELSTTYVPPFREIKEETEDFIIYKDGTKYHKSNNLNDLTSNEWLKFQKSWFVLNPKPRDEDVMLHPAKFPEELASMFISFFTKIGQTVLDPMLGTGTTLISAAQLGRNGVGIELQKKYSDIAWNRLKKISLQTRLNSEFIVRNRFKIYNGDARNIGSLKLKKVDYIFTSPPYWDMLLEKGSETQEKRAKNNYDVFYSKDDEDVGNIREYNQFIKELVSIYRKVTKVLKPGGYMTIVVKNVKKESIIYPLAWDLAKELNKFKTLELKDEKIWCQGDINLAPYGYRNAWVSNTFHHYCLNFRRVKGPEAK